MITAALINRSADPLLLPPAHPPHLISCSESFLQWNLWAGSAQTNPLQSTALGWSWSGPCWDQVAAQSPPPPAPHGQGAGLQDFPVLHKDKIRLFSIPCKGGCLQWAGNWDTGWCGDRVPNARGVRGQSPTATLHSWADAGQQWQEVTAAARTPNYPPCSPASSTKLNLAPIKANG